MKLTAAGLGRRSRKGRSSVGGPDTAGGQAASRATGSAHARFRGSDRFEPIGPDELAFAIEPAAGDLLDLLGMTPDCRHLDDATLAQAGALDALPATASMTLLAFDRRHYEAGSAVPVDGRAGSELPG